MADTPEHSDHTRIKQRIEHAQDGTIPLALSRFQGEAHRDNLTGCPSALEHDFELADRTERITRTNKRGSITSDLPLVLERLGIGQETWLILSYEFEESFSQWVGSEDAIRRAIHNVGKTRSRSPPIPAG